MYLSTFRALPIAIAAFSPSLLNERSSYFNPANLSAGGYSLRNAYFQIISSRIIVCIEMIFATSSPVSASVSPFAANDKNSIGSSYGFVRAGIRATSCSLLLKQKLICNFLNDLACKRPSFRV